jgi:PEP-CTERM motif-containing protein
MKPKILLAVFALAAVPAFGNSIPGPVTSFSVSPGEWVNFPGSNAVLQIHNGSQIGGYFFAASIAEPPSLYAGQGYISVVYPNALLGSGWNSGSFGQDQLSNAVYNASTHVLTATLSGNEFVHMYSNVFAVYSVVGIYQGNVNLSQTISCGEVNFGEITCGETNGGSISISNATFIGTQQSPTPEPGALALMGTGLCGIVGVLRWKLKRV